MGPSIEFIIKAFKGQKPEDKWITGNDEFKADTTLRFLQPVSKSTKRFIA